MQETEQPQQPVIGDAFGEALLAVMRGDDGLHVVERDDGFVDPLDAEVYFAPPERWPALDRAAIDLVSGRVLDVGAGAGRASLALQRRGHSPVALDTSPGAVAVCTERGVRHVFAGTVGDLAADSPERFDAAVLLGNNLGLLASGAQSRRLLDTFRHLLRPTGVIVGTCLDPYVTDDPNHLAYHERNRARGRLPGQVRIRVRRERLATDWFDYLFVSREELAGLAGDAGWRLTDATSANAVYLATMVPT